VARLPRAVDSATPNWLAWLGAASVAALIGCGGRTTEDAPGLSATNVCQSAQTQEDCCSRPSDWCTWYPEQGGLPSMCADLSESCNSSEFACGTGEVCVQIVVTAGLDSCQRNSSWAGIALGGVCAEKCPSDAVAFQEGGEFACRQERNFE
jgi:hypothetical protein